MSHKKVLVTGGAGFIGSHLSEALVRSGYRVAAFLQYNSRGAIDDLEYVDPSVLSEIELVWGDLKDPDSVRRAVKGCDIVFHLGALIGIPYSYQNPRDVVETNVLGTLNVLEAARDYGVSRVLHTSTSEVYGTARMEKITEEHPLQGQSPYSASKIGADKIAESYFDSYGLPVVTIRPFNTYGPRQSMRGVIPTIIGQALFQEVIHVGSLEPMRDFTFVLDTVDAFLKAATIAGNEGKTINLGVGKTISIGNILERIMALTGAVGKKVVRQENRQRPEQSEVMRLCSDNSLALKCLGWSPQTSLEEGLSKTIHWVRDNRERYSAIHYVV